ncbi:class I SAM-dependent methyltransferase [Thermodesulfobacteriota bacterium]
MIEKSKGITLGYLADYYDILTFTERSKFRSKQISLINLQEGEKVLDVGCGTGALSILAGLLVGETGKIEGIDLAPEMIEKAKAKAKKNKLKIKFRTASIDELPYPDEFFDVVISSMMFHHLPIEVKKKGLEEICRVLIKGGKFFLSDFCSPHYITIPIMYLMFIWISSTRFQLLGKLPKLIEESSFKTMTLLKKGFFLEYYLMTKG